MPRENLLVFSARRVREVFATYVRIARLFWSIDCTRRRIRRDPLRRSYTDVAITPIVAAAQEEHLELYRTSDAARQAVIKARTRAAARRPRAAVADASV